MWMKNNYKIMYVYTLKEIIAKGLSTMAIPYTENYPKANSKIFTRDLFNTYGITAPANTLLPNKYVDNDNLGILNRVIERYWDEYVFESEYDVDDVTTNNEVLYKVRRFLAKFIDIILNTYDKYSKILDSYETAKNKLLDQLERTTTGNDTRRENDTPQDGGDYADDNHTSYINKGETSVIEKHDDTSLIERIDKIQNLYQKVMLKWVNEFSQLFIDGGNIYEL